MSPDNPPTQNHSPSAPETELWLLFSEWARDAGDRAFCFALIVAVAAAAVLGAVWVWAMPSFG
jgi:hypothetical protein